MTSFLYVLLGILILSLLVFIHEGGHYLASRAFGVRVTEFMLGLPGPNVGITRRGTKFGVTPILLGGYARVCGMEPGGESPHLEAALASLYRRGTANMEDVAADCGISDDEAYEALEQLVSWGSCSGPAKKDEFNTYRAREVRADELEAERRRSRRRPLFGRRSKEAPMPSDAAAFEVAAGRGVYALGEARPVFDSRALFESERRQQYRSLPFWKRSAILIAGPAMNLLLVFAAFIIVYGVMGIDYLNQETGETFHHNFAPWECIVIGFNYLGMVVEAVAGLFNPATAAETVSQSSSVVGIVALTGSVFEQGLQNGLFFVAAISASLGVMNLLPIPPLDGGKFVIEVIQRVTRRPVSEKVQNNISLAGMAAFLLLFVVLLNQDIQNFILK